MREYLYVTYVRVVNILQSMNYVRITTHKE